MDDLAGTPTEDVAVRHRLEADRTVTNELRLETARVSLAIAATECAVADTLRALAAEDRLRGRTAAADRREAHAQDAERFPAHERAAASTLTGPRAPAVDRR